MDFTSLLKYAGDLGALGVLGLFIVVGGYIIHQGLRLFRENVIPLVKNHLEHLEQSYERMAAAIDKQSDALDGMKGVQAAQSEALSSHNELTRELIARLPKDNRVKRLGE